MDKNKNKNTKKPRITTVTLDMGKSTTANGYMYDPKTGKVAVLNNGEILKPQKAFVEQSYERTKKPKVLNRIETHPDILFANPNRILEQFDTIYAVDTNTKVINSRKVSVTGIVVGENIKNIIQKQTAIRYRAIFCLEFRNLSCKPENLGWSEAIKGICRTSKYNKRKRIALVVDSDLGLLDAYNNREKPLIKDYFLPENFSLIYASTDSGKENISNKMLKLADRISNLIFDNIKSNRSNNALIKASNEKYTHYRIWEIKE